MSKRLNRMHKKTTGVGEGAAHDRVITITAAEWNAVIENIEILEKRIETQAKEFADFLKQMKRGR